MTNDFLVRTFDVATGKFLQNIRREPSRFDNVITSRVNSNYVVIAATESEWVGHSKLFIYDLKCLKESDTVPSHLLLTTIDLQCKVVAMLLNEIYIVYLSENVCH